MVGGGVAEQVCGPRKVIRWGFRLDSRGYFKRFCQPIDHQALHMATFRRHFHITPDASQEAELT